MMKRGDVSHVAFTYGTWGRILCFIARYINKGD